jgi:large subunit ribosomal protein L31
LLFTIIFAIIQLVKKNYMKKEIHPPYYKKSETSCACGASFNIGSTKEKIKVEVCSSCHPFYTGKKKILDTMGRVEKFNKRLAQKKK